MARQSILIAVIAVTLLSGSGLAFLLGSRALPIENRSSQSFPGWSSGWDVLDDLGRFLADRLPLRQNAVRADAWIDEHV